MEFPCPRCLCPLVGVAPELGGEAAQCERCGGEFIVPIPDPERLLDWARTAPWDRLEEGIRTRIGRGHQPRTVHLLIRIFEKRRDQEIWKRELKEHGEVLSTRDRIWRATERRLEKRQWCQSTLEELLKMDPVAFERFVADLFVAQGYNASATGGIDDQGMDVEIWNQKGDLWGVAQCKRYGDGNRISSANIREFAGAYLLSGAAKGFYFTTGQLTRDARKLVGDYRWLTVYDGPSLVRYIRDVRAQA